jgi:hypothetical protein
MMRTDQFISHNLDVALFLYDPQKITLNGFTIVLLKWRQCHYIAAGSRARHVVIPGCVAES